MGGMGRRLITYLRVSTHDQTLDAQRLLLEAWADDPLNEAMIVDRLEHVGVSGASDFRQRPGVAAVLRRCAAGEVDGLLAARIDRFGRCAEGLAGLVNRAAAEGWELIALNMPMALSSPEGRLMYTILGGFAQYEREQIGARTRAGIAARKAEGTYSGGRPRWHALDGAVADRVAGWRVAGMGLQEIADRLNAEGVSTASGRGRWWPKSVSRVLAQRAGL